MEADHTLNLNDINRTWQDQPSGLFHALCRCGEEFKAMTIESITKQFIDHTNDKELGIRR